MSANRGVLRKLLDALRGHWPEYLMEAWGLGVFMISAGIAATLLEYPGSPLHAAIDDADLRRFLMAIIMGLTAVAIIYSPWGQQSGAHLNPAVTFIFCRLGKVAPIDAIFYVVAQFIGGMVGVVVVKWVFGDAFTAPPVRCVVTVPGEHGVIAAFVAELLISMGLMLGVLAFSNNARLQRLTGVFAGLLVASYITFEAPVSGMSMNPARSLASAAPSGVWDHLWIYFVAPPLGMLIAAHLYVAVRSRAAVHCAKLDHAPQKRCIHCGYEPTTRSEVADGAAKRPSESFTGEVKP